MRTNIPLAVLLIMTALDHYFFEHDVCTVHMKIGIVISFSMLGLFNILWTCWHCRVEYQHYYPSQHWYQYAILQSIVSTFAFYTFNYYAHKGVPFNCFFPYNALASEITFYLSFLLIIIISTIEHRVWKKIPSTLLLN